MTIDSVVQKTGISLLLVIVAAAITWFTRPPPTRDGATEPINLGPLVAALTIGSLGAFGLSMVNSFKRVISPALVLAFAVLEGVALGAFSKLIDAQFSTATPATWSSRRSSARSPRSPARSRRTSSSTSRSASGSAPS